MAPVSGVCTVVEPANAAVAVAEAAAEPTEGIDTAPAAAAAAAAAGGGVEEDGVEDVRAAGSIKSFVFPEKKIELSLRQLASRTVFGSFVDVSPLRRLQWWA